MTTQPFDDRDGTIWLDGKLIPWREAKIHVLTHALHYASSVFEGERAYNGKIFKLREHSARLMRSAELLDFKIPYSVEEIDAATEATLKASKLSNAYIRPIAWRGSEVMGVSAQKSRIHLAIACWEWPSYFSPEMRAKGISMIISNWARPAPNTAPVEAKAAGLYMICTLSKHKAELMGCQDALMLDWRGQVAEATGANIFLLIDGKLHTPKPECILNGITRLTAIEIARSLGLEVVERAIWPDDLKKATEVFVTGTAAEITPVGRIGDISYTPAQVCQKIAEEYTKKVLV